MLRRLFTLLSALSLLLCTVLIVLWLRSYWRNDYIGYRWANNNTFAFGHVVLGTENGKIVYDGLHGVAMESPNNAPTTPLGLFVASAPRVGPSYHLVSGQGPLAGLGFGYTVHHEPNGPYVHSADGLTLVIPLWSIVPFLLILPARYAFLKRRDHLRRLRGHCPSCGYDLRASKDKCPECGTPIHADAQPPTPAPVPLNCEQR